MDEGVPPVPGPKMYPFKDGNGSLKIEWLGHIGKGVHAHVWAVLINAKLYALKVFSFRKGYWVNKKWNVSVSKKEKDAYFDLFSCECRAYGRIREESLEPYVAQCYGYIKLKHDDFMPIWDNPYLEDTLGYRERHKGRPFRTLVKEYIETDPYIYPPLPDSNIDNALKANVFFRDAKDARHMIRGLKRIQKSGILVQDINDGNVMNGRLVDFSQAWTVPHPVLVKEKMENDEIVDIMDGGYRDASKVDELIDWWNEEHAPSLKIWDRCLPHSEYCDKIRYHNEREEGKFGTKWEFGRTTCGWYIRPERYKWKADDGLKG
ncbi:hypothetical protein PG996_005186 [Apiospora saccharicola]|uniref:Protein kinase domain-containing protein n=1 Tax=Apiospora saccharicola TaxID=335842 RepID=A0ABR1VPS2_9PEZI